MKSVVRLRLPYRWRKTMQQDRSPKPTPTTLVAIPSRWGGWAGGILAVMWGLGGMIPSLAQTVNPHVFQPYFAQMRAVLPPSLILRLPDQVVLQQIPANTSSPAWVVRFRDATYPAQFQVSLQRCDRGPLPCLAVSFLVQQESNPSARREWQRHQTQGTAVTLTPTVRAYLWEGDRQKPPQAFSSLMWQQEGMLYTISAPAQARQDLLFLGRDTATSPGMTSDRSR